MSSASRELMRPRPIPAKLREAISLMVYGRLDDPASLPRRSQRERPAARAEVASARAISTGPTPHDIRLDPGFARRLNEG
jgi:hypothetical protein